MGTPKVYHGQRCVRESFRPGSKVKALSPPNSHHCSPCKTNPPLTQPQDPLLNHPPPSPPPLGYKQSPWKSLRDPNLHISPKNTGKLCFRDTLSHWVKQDVNIWQTGSLQIRKVPLIAPWCFWAVEKATSASRDIWAGWNYPCGVAHLLPCLSNTLLLMYFVALLSNRKNLCCNSWYKTQIPITNRCWGCI